VVQRIRIVDVFFDSAAQILLASLERIIRSCPSVFLERPEAEGEILEFSPGACLEIAAVPIP
jgi:hypothetical protein